ncbi:MAG: aminotransferase class I/II-fold pyridoxal phosphate-dependent enzyme [Planctomycetaceae bacterium]|nr:MAG: aminotransferase class I/II-fold pyridoxal phosphate-dependent enzyme [Planctomycetaceae bacterium]
MSDPFKIEVSSRIKRLPPYLFGQINKLKSDKRRDGVDIIDLGMGNPHDAPPKEVVDKLCQAAQDPRNHGYSVSHGVYNLRREVARLYERQYGVTLDPDKEVIATIGSKEGFSHMCLALMGPGDTAVVGDPYFPIHVYAVALAGANVINVPLGNDEAFLRRVSDVVEHLYPQPKLLILNYPHNPTAMTVDNVSFFESVVALARRRNIMVIHDFAYGRTCFDDYTAPSFMQAKGAKDVGVEFITMSKPYNMAGWRLGFCVGNAEMIKALATIKGYYDYGHFQAIQIAGIMAMRNGEKDVARQAGVYQARRDIVVNGLRKMGWEVESPRGGMFVWAKVSEQHLAGQGTIDFALRLMEDAEVAVSPGRAFGEMGEKYVRIALVENELRLKQAIRNMDRALNKGIKSPTGTKRKRKPKDIDM